MLLYVSWLLQGGTIKFIVDYLHIDRDKNAKKSLCEEINSKLFEHIMTGIEVRNQAAKNFVWRSQSKFHWKKCSNSHFYCLIRSSLVNMGSSMLEIDSIIMIGRYIFVLICLLYNHSFFVLRNHQNLIFSSVPEEVVLCAQLWATHAEGVCFPKKTQKVLIFSTCEIWIRLSQKIRFSFLN